MEMNEYQERGGLPDDPWYQWGLRNAFLDLTIEQFAKYGLTPNAEDLIRFERGKLIYKFANEVNRLGRLVRESDMSNDRIREIIELLQKAVGKN